MTTSRVHAQFQQKEAYLELPEKWDKNLTGFSASQKGRFVQQILMGLLEEQEAKLETYVLQSAHKSTTILNAYSGEAHIKGKIETLKTIRCVPLSSPLSRETSPPAKVVSSPPPASTEERKKRGP